MRIVLFGATGYTGRLTAHALVRRGAEPVLAGRDPQRLHALATEAGGAGEIVVADSSDEGSVRGLVKPGDVLVSTVGPFTRLGRPAAWAAVGAGATYLDSTGEAAFVRWLLDEVDAPARRAGATLAPAFGYDYVPGNLAAEMALRRAPEATHVRVGYFLQGSGGPSGGTLASGAGMVIDPAYAWRGGRLVPDHLASRMTRFDLDGRSRQAVSLAGSEHLWLPRRHEGLVDVGVYLGWAGRRSRLAQVGSTAVHALTTLPGGRALAQAVAQRVVRGSTGGPDADARARFRTRVVAEAALPGRGPLARVVLDGPNPYDLTAELLAWGATRATSRTPEKTGVVGPADLFGYDELETACAEVGLRPIEEAV
ncbi:MAG: saccharopine dehydrogenase family protein [Actinomycetes bacterium]